MFITGNTGWPKGTSQLKPAAETWWLARTGRSTALNIDACRVSGTRQPVFSGAKGTAQAEYGAGTVYGESGKYLSECHAAGRYPPNAVFSHAPGCRCVGERRVRGDARQGGGTRPGGFGDVGTESGNGVPCGHGYADPDGTELVETWECVEGCPVRELDAQSGERPPGWFSAKERRGLGYGGGAGTSDDTGTAARFFPQFPADPAVFQYVAKPSRAERNAGVSVEAAAVSRYSGMGQGPQQTPRVESPQSNTHPTVKSVALMRWLVRLVTRPGDVVLDPFGGSGTTGVAALAEGRRVILVEREPRFAEIARQRCEHVTPDLGVPVRVPARAVAAPTGDARQLGLFDTGGVR